MFFKASWRVALHWPMIWSWCSKGRLKGLLLLRKMYCMVLKEFQECFLKKILRLFFMNVCVFPEGTLTNFAIIFIFLFLLTAAPLPNCTLVLSKSLSLNLSYCRWIFPSFSLPSRGKKNNERNFHSTIFFEKGNESLTVLPKVLYSFVLKKVLSRILN